MDILNELPDIDIDKPEEGDQIHPVVDEKGQTLFYTLTSKLKETFPIGE